MTTVFIDFGLKFPYWIGERVSGEIAIQKAIKRLQKCYKVSWNCQGYILVDGKFQTIM